MQKAQLFKVYGCRSKPLKVIKMVWCKSALNVFSSICWRKRWRWYRQEQISVALDTELSSAKNRGGSCYLLCVESPVTS